MENFVANLKSVKIIKEEMKMKLSNLEIKQENNILKGFVECEEIEKSHIAEHLRKTKSGIMSTVKAYEDKRQKKKIEKQADKEGDKPEIMDDEGDAQIKDFSSTLKGLSKDKRRELYNDVLIPQAKGWAVTSEFKKENPTDEQINKVLKQLSTIPKKDFNEIKDSIKEKYTSKKGNPLEDFKNKLKGIMIKFKNNIKPKKNELDEAKDYLLKNKYLKPEAFEKGSVLTKELLIDVYKKLKSQNGGDRKETGKTPNLDKLSEMEKNRKGK